MDSARRPAEKSAAAWETIAAAWGAIWSRRVLMPVETCWAPDALLGGELPGLEHLGGVAMGGAEVGVVEGELGLLEAHFDGIEESLLVAEARSKARVRSASVSAWALPDSVRPTRIARPRTICPSPMSLEARSSTQSWRRRGRRRASFRRSAPGGARGLRG